MIEPSKCISNLLQPYIKEFGRQVNDYYKTPEIVNLDPIKAKVRLVVLIDDKKFIVDEVVKKTDGTPDVRREITKKLMKPPSDEKIEEVFKHTLKMSCNLYFESKKGKIAWKHVNCNIDIEKQKEKWRSDFYVYTNATLGQNITELVGDFKNVMQFFESFDDAFEIYKNNELV